jgi:DNA-binding CsgD family transcriptional regulator
MTSPLVVSPLMESMPCSVPISREAELRQLVAALNEAELGHGSFIFLTGDPGVGKSRLARELAARHYGSPGAVLVLEDIHWADPQTLAIVEYLADNLAGKELLCVATLRDGEASPGLGALRPALAEAAAAFEATGHSRLAAACRGILRRLGQRVPRPGRSEPQVPGQMREFGITSRELDVYRLVARGLSNAEIAGRLFISPTTVETHVASLVTKTGKACRRELFAHAARSAQWLIPSRAAVAPGPGLERALAR